MPIVAIYCSSAVQCQPREGNSKSCIIYCCRCWLVPEALIGAVLAPVGVIIVINIIAFVLVVRQLRRVTRRRGSTYSESHSKDNKRSNMSMQIRGALAVFVLLGLTWAMAGNLVLLDISVYFCFLCVCNRVQHLNDFSFTY